MHGRDRFARAQPAARRGDDALVPGPRADRRRRRGHRDRRQEPADLSKGRGHRRAVRQGAGALPRDRQGIERRAADRRRQRRQLHRGARHPDARRAGRRRQGRPCRLRADLFLLADAAHLSLRAAAGDVGLMVTIFHVPDSRSLRVLWTLEEMGVKADLKPLPFPPRRLQPDYLAVNPAGTVPAMVDGDRVMTESLAICEVLVARHGNTSLVVAPGDPERPPFLPWLWYGG